MAKPLEITPDDARALVEFLDRDRARRARDWQRPQEVQDRAAIAPVVDKLRHLSTRPRKSRRP